MPNLVNRNGYSASRLEQTMVAALNAHGRFGSCDCVIEIRNRTIRDGCTVRFGSVTSDQAREIYFDLY